MPVSRDRQNWRKVPGTDLLVSDHGLVLQRGKIISNPRRKFGKGGCLGRICHLVLLVFVGPCPDGMECCHWDDNPSNNKIGNLRWGTKRDNARDALRNGNHIPLLGEDNGRAKLTTSKVVLIRLLNRLDSDVWTSQILSSIFGVTNAVVWHVLNYKTWKHLP